jgi:hypothetical protein
MSVFTIESLPAAFGDALWIEYGEPGALRRVLIDGGVAETFELIERRLDRLPAPRRFELLVVTHVDEDHIAGAVRLLGALRDLDVRFEDIWFNGREHLEGRRVVLDRLGAKQGEFLSALISKQTTRWNMAFDGFPAQVGDDARLPAVELEGGLRLTLLSPTGAELRSMAAKWDKELAAGKEGIDWTDADQVLEVLSGQRRLKPRDQLGGSRDVDELAQSPFTRDTSKANGSSIAMLAEFAGRSVLLGADAYPTVLARSIDRLLAARGERRLAIDLVKVPHHGSRNNVSKALLDRLDCRHYLISTNGDRYRHPDREAIARIVRYGGDTPVLHFNYRSEFTEFWDDEDLGRGTDYEVRYPDGDPGCRIDLIEPLAPRGEVHAVAGRQSPR